MIDRVSEHHVDERRSKVLLLDALINIVLGLLLATFPDSVVRLLGVPATDTRFYPSILGAVLLGIGVALLIEFYRKPSRSPGLGLSGAIAINLCGAVFLIGWLLTGTLNIPLRGKVFLWTVAVALVTISGSEWWLMKRIAASPTSTDATDGERE
jgi:peptidoglycan/LPS O-acetylase OafA/YrhL